MPALSRWGLARVRGRSMEPTLRAGDLLLVRYDAPVVPGAVALVDLPDGTLAVKRLTARSGETWTAESDNGLAPGAWTGLLDSDAVRGVVLLRAWPRPGRLGPPPAR